VFRARSIFEPVTRFVACAAFLACSLFGKSLHDLHHILSESTQNESSSGCCRHSHAACDSPYRLRGEQHTAKGTEAADGHRHPDQSPGHPHDPHNCAVCDSLCISATSPESVAVLTDHDPASWSLTVFNETFAECCDHSDEARGPPSLALQPPFRRPFARSAVLCVLAMDVA